MRNCRNEAWRRLSGVAALAALVQLASPAACAEVGPPVPLNAAPPPREAAPQPAATPAEAPAAAGETPAPDAGAPAAEAPASAAPPTDESIVATPLAPPDSSWAAALGDGDHPLPATLWQGTPRPLVATLLPQLGPTASPAWQNLARRLLLSGGASPQGEDAPDHPGLPALRVDRLKALGEIAGALASTATTSTCPSP
jgi:hypothetical protein